jgi:hypothetical protein
MTDPVREASRRLQRAASADGLSELAAGALFLMPALLEWAKAGYPGHSAEWRILNVAQMLVLFPGIWIVIWALPRIRNRLFAGRTGVMLPRLAPEGAGKAAAAAVVAVMTAVVLVIMRTGGLLVPLTTLTTGLGAALILLETGRRAGIRRFQALAALIAALSLAIAARFPDFTTAFLRQFGSVGLLLALSGAFTLVRFLHDTGPQSTH